MPFYMLQAAYDRDTETGPEPAAVRGEAVAAQLEKLGGRLISFSEHSGSYDATAICELPDDVAAGTLTISVRGPGHLRVAKAARLRGGLTSRLARLGRTA